MTIFESFKNLPARTKALLAAGGILGLLVALPLFIFAITNNQQNFDIRNRAQEIIQSPSPSPSESPTASPSVEPSSSPEPSPSPSPSVPPSASHSPSPLACETSDINKDGITDLTDYSVLVSDFFKNSPTNPRSDVNGDGIVDITDYSILVSKFFSQTGACN